MIWCEHCRDHFDTDHYDTPLAIHGAGPEFGPYGVLLATEKDHAAHVRAHEEMRQHIERSAAARLATMRRLRFWRWELTFDLRRT